MLGDFVELKVGGLVDKGKKVGMPVGLRVGEIVGEEDGKFVDDSGSKLLGLLLGDVVG